MSGTLDKKLIKKTWIQRLDICIFEVILLGITAVTIRPILMITVHHGMG